MLRSEHDKLNIQTHSSCGSLHSIFIILSQIKIPAWILGGTHEASPPVDKLLAVDGGLGKEGHFSLELWPLIGCL